MTPGYILKAVGTHLSYSFLSKHFLECLDKETVKSSDFISFTISLNAYLQVIAASIDGLVCTPGTK